MVESENYSIQALNLLDSLVNEYKIYLKNIRRDTFYFQEIKKLRFNINNKYRRISDLAEIKNDTTKSNFRIIVYNVDYKDLIVSELDNLKLKTKVKGQFIIVKKPKLTFNQLMTIVDDLEKYKTKFISKCTKAKLEPVLRAKNALENDFIDIVISRETSLNCQKIYEEKEAIINKITNEKIMEILEKEFYEKYLIENPITDSLK